MLVTTLIVANEKYHVRNVLLLCSRVKMGHYYVFYLFDLGFLRSSDGKESTCNAGDLGSMPELEDH